MTFTDGGERRRFAKIPATKHSEQLGPEHLLGETLLQLLAVAGPKMMEVQDLLDQEFDGFGRWIYTMAAWPNPENFINKTWAKEIDLRYAETQRADELFPRLSTAADIYTNEGIGPFARLHFALLPLVEVTYPANNEDQDYSSDSTYWWTGYQMLLRSPVYTTVQQGWNANYDSMSRPTFYDRYPLLDDWHLGSDIPLGRVLHYQNVSEFAQKLKPLTMPLATAVHSAWQHLALNGEVQPGMVSSMSDESKLRVKARSKYPYNRHYDDWQYASANRVAMERQLYEMFVNEAIMRQTEEAQGVENTGVDIATLLQSGNS